MAKFYLMGCYTQKGLAGFVDNPSTNRKAATQALLESGGAKLTDYSILRGAFDFISVCDGTFELMAASKNNIQVGSFSDGENCCFCSCKVDSLAESLKLIKINE